MESRRRFKILLFLRLVFEITEAYDVSSFIDLTGTWTVFNSGKNGTLYTVQGKVPGNMYTALLSNGKIMDPYYMYNDDQYRWIPRDDWTYQKTFEVSSDFLSKSRVILSCEGLDTVATVKVNGKVVGKTENMFVKYDFDVKSFLKVGVNEIVVEFRSAIEYAAEKAGALPHPIPPECSNPVQHGECHVNVIRKEQCSFSWDWGPSFPTQGIWKNISLVAFDTAVIEYLTAETYKESNSWILSIGVYYKVTASVSGNFSVTLLGTSLKTSFQAELSSENNFLTKNYTLSDVAAWWPNGFGDQTLYRLNVSFSSGSEKTSKSIRVGFRTVELVQDPIPNHGIGLTFYFKVNGLPIFMKGSNWIPADSFQDRVTPARYRDLLTSAAEVNMNCLRVWGGGIYEDDAFYDIADELGIMIWQDFMFAVALYPAEQSFLNLVAMEVTHQVRRLKSHPSILLWAGNNENEKALAQDWFGVKSQFELYKKEYIDLYIKTIAPIVAKEDRSRPFVSSSPSNGKETESEGWVAKDPGDWHYGDEHFYDFTSDFWNISTFPILRFSSEYGIQSWSSFETVAKVSESSAWDFWSKWCEHRQHHPQGNIQMMTEISRHFTMTDNPNKKQKFQDMIYLTQINQALSVRFESEHYRRFENQLINDFGLTMGALYWQLNDIWQAPTWASIEYGGKWKMLHYYAKRFFAPTLISPYTLSNYLRVYVSVDQLSDRSDQHQMTNSTSTMKHVSADATKSDTLYIQMYSWSSLTPLYTWKQPYTLTTRSQLVFMSTVDKMLSTANCPARSNCILVFHINDITTGPNTWYPLTSFSQATMQKANIQVTNIDPPSEHSMTFTISLSTDKLAAFVWLEATGIQGRFSDNGFLFYTPTLNVTFTSTKLVDPAALRMALNIKYLKGIYDY